MTEPSALLYPLQFEPVVKSYVWGGRAIGEVLGRPIPDGPVAESWEISAHPDGLTRITRGRLAGGDLESVSREHGEELLGRRNKGALERRRFPLLIKILDAHQWLSVQVHPDDAHALARHDDFGKTEMWIVLAADRGAELLLGFREGVDRRAFADAIERGTAADLLNRVPATAGDVFFIPPGTPHAIGPGLLLVEIQQSSNTTYRVFDWNRQPPRPLHVDDALEVLDFDAVDLEPMTPVRLSDKPLTERLASCRYFETQRLRLESGDEFSGVLSGDSFEIWGSLTGSVTVESDADVIDLHAIAWVLLPASLGRFRLRAGEPSTLLRVFVPAVD